MARRERGRLEAEVLQTLWAHPGGLTSGQLELSFAPEVRPARTTVLTILSRLEDKGQVTRSPGRTGALFRAVAGEADHVATAMSEILQGAGDREAALSHFVGRLDEADRAALVQLFGSS